MADYGKKKKLYFTPKMDIALLKEVLEKNPFENGSSVYIEITSNLKSNDSFCNAERRTLQDRTDRLLKVFRSEQLHSLRRSGTQEEYDVREKLLQVISDLEIEWRGFQKQRTPKMYRAEDQTPTAAWSKAVKLMEELNENQAEEELAPEEAKMEDTSFAEDTYTGRIKQMRQSPVAGWSSALQFMESKLELEQKVKADALERQKEELAIRKEELEVKKKEAENERIRLDLMREEQQHRLRLEETRRKEESEERRLLMDRQIKMIDMMFAWMQEHKK